jgi:hypothetical protein
VLVSQRRATLVVLVMVRSTLVAAVVLVPLVLLG